MRKVFISASVRICEHLWHLKAVKTFKQELILTRKKLVFNIGFDANNTRIVQNFRIPFSRGSSAQWVYGSAAKMGSPFKIIRQGALNLFFAVISHTDWKTPITNVQGAASAPTASYGRRWCAVVVMRG